MIPPNTRPDIDSAMSRSEQNRAKLRAYQHVFMGVLYLFIGCLVMYQQQFGSFDLSGGMAYFLGALFLIYGAFRTWRGVAEIRSLKRMR